MEEDLGRDSYVDIWISFWSIFKWFFGGSVKGFNSGFLDEFWKDMEEKSSMDFPKDLGRNTNVVFKWILKAPGRDSQGEFLMNFFKRPGKGNVDFGMSFWRSWKRFQNWFSSEFWEDKHVFLWTYEKIQSWTLNNFLETSEYL